VLLTAIRSQLLILVQHLFSEFNSYFRRFFINLGLKEISRLFSLEKISLKHANIEDFVSLSNQLHFMVKELEVSIFVMTSYYLVFWNILCILDKKLIVFRVYHSMLLAD